MPTVLLWSFILRALPPSWVLRMWRDSYVLFGGFVTTCIGQLRVQDPTTSSCC
ncbi:hypothetical protein E2C01_068349 [Portunus trituberculatus]|uniref:Uncharacterized protein n=1 Tax=Portunus trituberculatus TaxID=210409 RepID=A0A5B7HVZ4_PORTR|nr:hypothetical protein [Portunus trituberculatus]